MGTSSMMDMIGSFFVAGTLLLMGLQMNASANEASVVYSGNGILQRNITTLVDIMETDFRRIGYCKDWTKIPDPSQSVRIAGSTKLRFLTDVENDGTLDSITYYLGPVSELAATPNPTDRYLYRQVNNGAPFPMNLGVTQFSLKYYDTDNDTIPFPITDPRKICYMEIFVAVASAFPREQQYMNDASQYDVFWKQRRLVTKNLRNR